MVIAFIHLVVPKGGQPRRDIQWAPPDVLLCLVPGLHYSVQLTHFGSRGPGEVSRPFASVTSLNFIDAQGLGKAAD